MLYSNLLRIINLCSSLHVAVGVVIDCSKYNFPQDRKKQTNCNRFTPIALLTSASKVISAPTLFITVPSEARINCTTVGVTIGDFVFCNAQKGFINATGGPAYRDKYYLDNLIFRFDIVPRNTRVVGTQDGVGTGIGVELAFFNYAYPPDSAYPDDVLRFSFSAEINGNAPNLEFEKFGVHILKHIRDFNSSAVTSAKNVLPWLLETFIPPYFIYPGSSKNPITAAFSPNSIWLETNFRSHPFISYPQYYKYLLKLKNAVGQPLEGVLPLYSQGNRPIREIWNNVDVKYVN